MNLQSTAYAYSQSDPSRRLKGIAIVIVVHVAIGYLAVSGLGRKGFELIKKPMEAVVIQEVIIPPPPPPPPPPKEVQQSRPDAPKEDVPPPPVQPVAQAQPAPVKAPEPPPPVEATPTPAPKAVVVETPAVDSKAVIASLEGEYISKVRAMLNSTKRYPTGRQASQQRPEGKVKVWFILTRSGSLVDAGVLESSDSNLLDDAALATVRRGTYPPFPATTWAGEEQRRFSVELTFTPPGV